MQGIVDRMEGEWIVLELESGEMVNLPRKILPEAAEGDVIVCSVDQEKTAQRREKLRELRRRLWEE